MWQSVTGESYESTSLNPPVMLYRQVVGGSDRLYVRSN